MVFGWKKKRASGYQQQEDAHMEHLIIIPNHFLCPISLDLMKDPVTVSSGVTYDRESIETWLEGGHFTCPVTNQVLQSLDQIPNHTLRKMIQEWCVENRNYGVERIPTPRIPVSPIQVTGVLSSIAASAKHLDQLGCLDLVRQIQKWGNESERNRRCIMANGASASLAAAFQEFATDSWRRNASVLEEILSTTTWMFPLDSETQKHLGSQSSLACMVWFLKQRDTNLSAKQNSLLTLKELLATNAAHQHVESLAPIQGVNEVLFGFIKDPIFHTITKDSLMLIFHLLSSTSSSDNIKSEFVEMGLLSLLLETIVDSEKSISERALAVIGSLCDCEDGRREAYNNALTMPVLVKKILRVSDLASEYSVSVIWKLSRTETKQEAERVLVEAVQVGAFQKLVLLLQLGCGEETKEKATELLKLMNPYRAGFECIESVDFKNLQRSF